MSEQDKPNDTPTGTGDGTGAGNNPQNAGNGGTFTPEQQAKVDQIIADRLSRAQAKWKEDAGVARKKAEEDAEAKRLEEQQQFKELHEKAQAKVVELEPQVKTMGEQIKLYEETLKAILDERMKTVPVLIKDAIANRPLLDQLKYLTDHAEEIAKQQQPPQGTPKTPGQRTLNRQPGQQEAAPRKVLRL